ncbi:MAG TPA: hypothetical protein VEC12_02525 [Bacteroidia bacterium]|nr:hypothetical protein [Bacteroidia bacterium]
MGTKSAFSKYILAGLLCCLVFTAYAQLPSLIPYRKGDLWGYCDSNKVVKIEPKFKYAGWFNELGQAEVHNLEPNGRGDSSYIPRYIDKNGNITEFKYYDFDSQYYYYNSGGKIVVVEKQTGKKNTHP